MSISAMRQVLKSQYNGALKWVNRVNNMSDSQVIAIYYRMLERGQIKN